jgi:hypothetical protein
VVVVVLVVEGPLSDLVEGEVRGRARSKRWENSGEKERAIIFVILFSWGINHRKIS